jgi:hypothetical protein
MDITEVVEELTDAAKGMEAREPAVEEVVVMDEAPEETLIVDEPEEKEFDLDKNRDLKKFLAHLDKLISKVPSHSGKTTAGCERGIAHCNFVDKLISKVIATDTESELDDQEVEKRRKQTRKMKKQLEKRLNEINDTYDADDEKYAAANGNGIVKEAIKMEEAQPGDLVTVYRVKVNTSIGGKSQYFIDPKKAKEYADMHKYINPTIEEALIDFNTGRVVEKKLNDDTNDEENDADDKATSMRKEYRKHEATGDHAKAGEAAKKLHLYHSDKLMESPDRGEHHDRQQKKWWDIAEEHAKKSKKASCSCEVKTAEVVKMAELHCKACGAKVKDQQAAKAHAATMHKGENVTFSDYEEQKTSSVSDDMCPKCAIKLWGAGDGIMECIACDSVFERKITKEAMTPKVQLVMSPFERSICGIIVNAYVSNGKSVENTYAELKKQYKFSDRDELSITQLLMDLGYPIARNLIGMPHGNIEFSTNYGA